MVTYEQGFRNRIFHQHQQSSKDGAPSHVRANVLNYPVPSDLREVGPPPPPGPSCVFSAARVTEGGGRGGKASKRAGVCYRGQLPPSRFPDPLRLTRRRPQEEQQQQQLGSPAHHPAPVTAGHGSSSPPLRLRHRAAAPVSAARTGERLSAGGRAKGGEGERPGRKERNPQAGGSAELLRAGSGPKTILQRPTPGSLPRSAARSDAKPSPPLFVIVVTLFRRKARWESHRAGRARGKRIAEPQRTAGGSQDRASRGVSFSGMDARREGALFPLRNAGTITEREMAERPGRAGLLEVRRLKVFQVENTQKWRTIPFFWGHPGTVQLGELNSQLLAPSELK
uniref:Uncharacterized protein n=1 Tax=Pogona vitticeps TaxID=103695 RepID=A0ABM5GDD0_9SAUR